MSCSYGSKMLAHLRQTSEGWITVCSILQHCRIVVMFGFRPLFLALFGGALEIIPAVAFHLIDRLHTAWITAIARLLRVRVGLQIIVQQPPSHFAVVRQINPHADLIE